ncbi:MAG: NUDIX hydrolase [Candidatus Bathyarchaeota archaeon]|nr:NUDIX hydrolase [Candidatus Bathyarchaeota archaeon]
MSREYPKNPIPGVAGIVVRGKKLLLVQRGREPSKGKWGIPGGVVEVGETVEEALVREVREETGCECTPLKHLATFDSIRCDDDGRVHWHYVLFEYLCRYDSGEPHASDDAAEARWVRLDDLGSVDIMESTRRFVEKTTREEGLI